MQLGIKHCLYMLSLVSGKQSDKGPELLQRRKTLETMLRAGVDPRQLLPGHCFDKGFAPPWIVKHRWTDIDELVHARYPREHPGLAGRAEIMAYLRTPRAPQIRRAGHDLKPAVRNHGRQGKGAGAHALTAAAVTRRSQQRWRGQRQDHCAATTLPAKRHGGGWSVRLGHGLSPFPKVCSTV